MRVCVCVCVCVCWGDLKTCIVLEDFHIGDRGHCVELGL